MPPIFANALESRRHRSFLPFKHLQKPSFYKE